MSTTTTPNHQSASQQRDASSGQAEPWLRLAFVMIVPVLLLLIGMSLTR